MASTGLSAVQSTSLFFFRACIVVYCWVMVFLQSLPLTVLVVQSFWRAYEPAFCRMCFFIMGLIHTFEFFKFCLRRCGWNMSKLELLALFPEQTFASFSAKGNLGRRSKAYSLAMLGLKVFDILSWTYQAHGMSLVSPIATPHVTCATVVGFSATGVLLIESLRTDKNHAETSARLLCLDICGDIIVTMLVPVGILIPVVSTLLQNTGAIYEARIFMKFCSAGEIATVSSFLDMLVRFIPLILLVFTTKNLEDNWLDAVKYKAPTQSIKSVQNLASTTPSSSSSISNVIRHWILLPFGVCWVSGVAIATCLSLQSNQCHQEISAIGCSVQSFPMTLKRKKCNCLYINYDCHVFQMKANWSTEQLFSMFENDIEMYFSRNARMVRLNKCGFERMPKSLQHFSQAGYLGVYTTDLVSTKLDISKMKYLSVFSLKAPRLRELQIQLPQHLSTLHIKNTQVADFELEPSLKRLENLLYMRIEDNPNLSTIPPNIFNAPNLDTLSLNHNAITDLPPSIKRLQKLRVLRLSGNHLTRLPEELTKLQQLTQLLADGNALQTIPWSKDEIRLWNTNEREISPGHLDFRVVLFSLSPICQVGHSLDLHDTKACEEQCNVGCTPVLARERTCHHACNTSACNFSNGWCDLQKAKRRRI